MSGQQEVVGFSSPPARYLNLFKDERFVLYLGIIINYIQAKSESNSTKKWFHHSYVVKIILELVQ